MNKKVIITGKEGFIGRHLCNYLSLQNDIEILDFDRTYFDHDEKLDKALSTADVIVHLAGMNRAEDERIIYDININLSKKIIDSLSRTHSVPHVIFSSSIQQDKDTLYGKSKRESNILFEKWAKEKGGKYTLMVIPNVFGPFGRPFYNSVISTFCHQLNNDETPNLVADKELELIYIDELIKEIKKIIVGTVYNITHTNKIKVSEILSKLYLFKNKYLDQNTFPTLENKFDINLFNTFRSYINYEKIFPIELKNHTDHRGSFIETIKTDIGGQISFSTTKRGLTRGNHFHTRKIERFIVIKGKALVKMRRLGDNQVLEFELNGDTPSFIDIPIWYIHNIKNVGEEDLYTMFYINEIFDEKDQDTYYEEV